MREEDKQRNRELAERLYSEERFAPALVLGGITAVIAAIPFAFVVAAMPLAYGFAAAGVGIAVGLSVGLGRGVSQKFAFVAAAWTLLSILLGSVTSIVFAEPGSPLEVLTTTPLPTLFGKVWQGFTIATPVYWLIAVFSAVFFARRSLTRAEKLAIGLRELR